MSGRILATAGIEFKRNSSALMVLLSTIVFVAHTQSLSVVMAWSMSQANATAAYKKVIEFTKTDVLPKKLTDGIAENTAESKTLTRKKIKNGCAEIVRIVIDFCKTTCQHQKKSPRSAATTRIIVFGVLRTSRVNGRKKSGINKSVLNTMD